MKNKGFSLIEASIALIIIGVMMGPLIHLYYDAVEPRKKLDTEQVNQSLIKEAIGNYYMRTRKYPCPADITAGPNSPDYGRANCAAANLVPVGTCQNGICSTNSFSDVDHDAGIIFSGGVPFLDLGIPAYVALDAYARKITYAVVRNFTDDADLTIDPRDNSIRYLERTFDSVTGNILNTEGWAQAVLLSHGENGNGAYTVSGVLSSDEVCIPNMLESENCNNDGLFIQTEDRGKANLADYYDDTISIITSVPTPIWGYSNGNDDDIYTTLNVGIGMVQGVTNIGRALDSDGNEMSDGVTGAPIYFQPDPQGNHNVRLDVNGNIRTDKVDAAQLCDIDGTGCFSPEVLGATDGMRCGNGNVALAMRGIENGKANCISGTPSGVSGRCPAGQFANRIVNGVLQCAQNPN